MYKGIISTQTAKLERVIQTQQAKQVFYKEFEWHE
jgi:hypothetical protein